MSKREKYRVLIYPSFSYLQFPHTLNKQQPQQQENKKKTVCMCKSVTSNTLS